MDWEHKDEWKARGSDFLVSVSRHTVWIPEDRKWEGDGGHRWCVYAYIYPKHRLFASMMAAERMFDDAPHSLPLHAGPSLFRKHTIDGSVTAVQVGADYNHLHDQHFTNCATQEEAAGVFADAERLFEHLSATHEVPEC